MFKKKSKIKPAAQAVGTNFFRCNYTNTQNPPIQQDPPNS